MKGIRLRPDTNFNRKLAVKSQGKRPVGSGFKVLRSEVQRPERGFVCSLNQLFEQVQVAGADGVSNQFAG
jgi:hypothetical protein